MLVPLVLAGVLLMVFPPRWLLWLFNARDAPLYVVSSQRVVALTIDDGVDPVATPPILEVLAKHQVRATFFVLASTIEAHPQLARDIVAAGHELGNHQTRDEPGFLMPDNAFAADIRRAGNLLAPYGPVRWLRPGGGITSSAMKQAAGEQGYRVVLGSVFPLDSHIASATFAVNFIEARVFAGSIVVLHDGPGRGERTARVLDRVLPRLKSAGFRVVPYGEL
jgi:peptidoglycan/xylan/chitin deacetylase (PgdA/CDA1 family)